MAYLDETGLKQVFSEVKSRIATAKSEAVAQITKDKIGYSADKVAVAMTTEQAESYAGLGISVTDGFGTTKTQSLGTYRIQLATASTSSTASDGKAGLMSGEEKRKLATIAEGANKYSLPQATASTLGGVKVGSNITVSSGTISLTKANVTAALGYTPATTNTTYSVATESANGLMAAADKVKLNKLSFDDSGMISSACLPSYVDDVVEGYYVAGSDGTGNFYSDSNKTQVMEATSGKIYVDLTTNKTYRYSGGGKYVEISSSLALGTTSSTAYAGDKGAALETRMTAVESKASSNASSISTINTWKTTVGSAIATATVTSLAKTAFGD